MKKLFECENCDVKQATMKSYEIMFKRAGSGGSAFLCEGCVAKAKAGELSFKIVERVKDGCPQCGERLAVDSKTGLKYCADCSWKEEKKVVAPSICPLLSIVTQPSCGFVDCQKEKCWIFNRQTRKCVFVMVAMTLGDLVLAQKPLKRRVKPSDLLKKP